MRNLNKLELASSEVGNASRIAIPKGENSKIYREVFTEFSGIEIPKPSQPRGLKATSGGVNFYWLKPEDIPGLVDLGVVDVGLTSTERALNYDFDAITKTIGQSVCRLSLLATESGNDWLNNVVFTQDRRYIVPMAEIPTRLPTAFEGICKYADWPFRASNLNINGSVELYAELLRAPAVADIVQTGYTAANNGLIENRTMLNVGPELIVAN